MKIKIFCQASVLVCFFSFPLIGGDADFTPSPRAKTLSLNGMYFAGADGLQSALGNPSALSLLNSKGLEINIADHIGQHEYENLQSDLFKSFNDDDFALGAGVFWTFSPSFTAAAAYQNAVDYKVDWPYVNSFRNDSASSLLAFDYSNQFSVNAASASFAAAIDQLSLGASFNFYYIRQHTAFPRSNERWNQGFGIAGYQVTVSQKGYSFGFNFGASLQLNQQLKIAVMSRSGFKADLEGTASSNMFTQLDSAASVVNTSSSFEMPWVIGAGILYEWTPGIKLNMDFQYNLWSGIQKTIEIAYENSIWRQGLSSADPLTGINAASFNLSFKNSFDLGIGVEYQASDVVLRMGYRFSQSPNSNESFNMLFPSVDKHFISIGVGYQYEKLLLEAAAAYAIGVSTDVSNTSIIQLSGNYKAAVFMPAVTLRYLL